MVCLTCGNSLSRILNYFHLNFQEAQSECLGEMKKDFRNFVDKFLTHEQEIYCHFGVREEAEFKTSKTELRSFVIDN